jgi:hypothetical protein
MTVSRSEMKNEPDANVFRPEGVSNPIGVVGR